MSVPPSLQPSTLTQPQGGVLGVLGVTDIVGVAQGPIPSHSVQQHWQVSSTPQFSGSSPPNPPT